VPGDQAALELVVLLEPTTAVAQRRSAVTSDRFGVGLAYIWALTDRWR
jgi:hypothetical protein